MIFSQQHVTFILAGQKTQHRWPWKPDTGQVRSKEGFRSGHSYAVQRWTLTQGSTCPRVGPTEARVRVVQVERQPLSEASERDALAEGYESLDHLISDWRRRYNEGPVGGLHIPTLVVRFELDKEPRSYYLANPVAGRSGDYTFSRSRAIDPLEVDQDDEFTKAWAAKAEEARRLVVAQAKLRWRMERRYGKDAA